MTLTQPEHDTVDSVLDAHFRSVEVRARMARLNDLYGRQHGGDTSLVTRSRVERCEALLAALQGHPDALVPDRPEGCRCNC